MLQNVSSHKILLQNTAYLCLSILIMKKVIAYGLFFVVLVALFWFFAFRGTDQLNKSSLTVISTVKPFSFTTQEGKKFTEDSMQGKVCVVEYFFTTCTGICPRMNTNMKGIYEEFKNEPSFMIVSHTSMPETDSVLRMKRYADSMHIDATKWVLLTGRKDSLYMAARNSYLLDNPKNSVQSIDDQFIHTQFFALVDKNGQVRGQVYDGLKAEDLDKLKHDIKDLLKERTTPVKFSNEFRQ